MTRIALIYLYVVSILQVNGQQACEKLGSAYATICPNTVNRDVSAASQGVPGKRGAIGEKGERGLQGSKGTKGNTGEADYDVIEEIISRRIKEVVDEQTLKSQKLSETLVAANERIKNLENRTGYCPMIYNGKCFWVVVRFSPPISFQQGRDLCADLGGSPANIYSESHYKMLMEHLRIFTIKDGVMHAWLGMTYDPATGTTHLTDGSRAPYVKWHQGYPRSSPCCNTALEAKMDWRLTGQHMWKSASSATPRGVICEK